MAEYKLLVTQEQYNQLKDKVDKTILVITDDIPADQLPAVRKEREAYQDYISETRERRAGWMKENG